MAILNKAKDIPILNLKSVISVKVEIALGCRKFGDFSVSWAANSSYFLLWFSDTVSLLWSTVHILSGHDIKGVHDVIQFEHNAANRIVVTRGRHFAHEAAVGSTVTNGHDKLLLSRHTVTRNQLSSLMRWNEETFTWTTVRLSLALFSTGFCDVSALWAFSSIIRLL